MYKGVSEVRSSFKVTLTNLSSREALKLTVDILQRNILIKRITVIMSSKE
jgi:hypothetical protein